MREQRADFVETGGRLGHRHPPVQPRIVIEGLPEPKRKSYRRGVAAPPAPDEPRRPSPGILAGFAAATGFLTRIPVAANPDGGQLADAAWAFPLVGAGIGAIAAVVFAIAQLIGLGDWPAALLAVLAGLLLTGALHEDGLADTVDGLAGGHNRERKLAIMRDSRVGSFGVLALVLSVGLRAAALAQTGEAVFAGLALIAAHAASRGLVTAAMRGLAPAPFRGSRRHRRRDLGCRARSPPLRSAPASRSQHSARDGE